MPFKPGVSGNPGGISKIQANFERKCREFMDEKGWEGLIQLYNDKKTRQWALNELMNRGFGRPKESLNVTSGEQAIPEPEQLASDIDHLIAGEAPKGSGINIQREGTA